MSTTNNALARNRQHATQTRPVSAPVTNQQGAPVESEPPCSSLLTGKSAATTCAGIRNNGERCRGRVSAGQEYCSFHRTDLGNSIRDGRTSGGRRGKYVVRPFEEQTGAHLALRLDSRGGIQGSIDSVLRMLVFGGISPAHANAATRLIATALRNLDHTNPETEDHSLDQYLASVSNYFMIKNPIRPSAPVPNVSSAQRPTTEAPALPASGLAASY